MIIGLMRHFPVAFGFTKWCDSDTFNREMDAYNISPVRHMKARHYEQEWVSCHSSTMKRALETARLVFDRPHIQTDLLREVPLVAGFRTRLKIPVFLWAVVGRLQWLFNSKRQPETRKQSYQRARSFLSQILLKAKLDHKLLIITHGFFMLSLRRELLRLGFRGPRLFHVKNGKLYHFEKEDQGRTTASRSGLPVKSQKR